MSVIYIDPIGKPRMTRSDKWKKRDCVLRYRCFADELRLNYKETKNQKTGSFNFCFYFKMPESWSKKKKEEMLGKPHKQKPDIDNIVKACLDALFKDDSFIYRIKAEKYWANEGSIIIQDL